MANLTDGERFSVWAEFMSDVSRDREACGINKADLRAAVDAIDSWINSNASSLNSAIPQPARGSLTMTQKARLLKLVINRRYLTGA